LDEKACIEKIAKNLNLKSNQVKNTIQLLDIGNTVPFIARYRKEKTGCLDEINIRDIQEQIRYLRNLNERKKTVFKNIEEQGKLTPELQKKIEAADKLQDVEDLYLPYKPKRRTRASVAREKGLEPLADLMMAQNINDEIPEVLAEKYLNEEAGVKTVKDALSGARDIIAERISENAELRKTIRETTLLTGMLASEGLDPEFRQDYEIYMDFKELIKTIPPHRILALNRGEREKKLRIWINVNYDEIITSIQETIITQDQTVFREQLELAAADSYQRLIAPSIHREIRKILTERADAHAISVFAQNLKSLLLTPPMHGKIILGIDPGFRTGCKVAVIDATAKYLEGDTIYPHPPQNQKQQALETLRRMVETYHVDIIAIGNGTASRETEQLISELIHQYQLHIQYTIVNEAGASVYSASPVAKQEFPDLDASMRGNISIARRLLDPLSELVKIDPKSIGVGLYQHDVDQNKLSESLDQVVESCVNSVGVDLNTASASLLKHISGINARTAKNIVKFRENNRPFTNRDDLKKVSGLGNNTFIQAAGFLRIPDANNFFDATAVHPESYSSAKNLLNLFQLNISDVMSDHTLLRQRMEITRESLQTLAGQCGCGKETLSDIIDSLEKPNRDPRDDLSKPILRNDILRMEDCHEGMICKGTVRNVVDFGAFVDIGVKQDGLVHLSQMAKRYIRHPLEVVQVGDVIDVKILYVDIKRKRIGLSLILDDS